MGIVKGTLEVFVISHDTAFADRKIVTLGTTVKELFDEMTGSATYSGYKVRVNRQAVEGSYVLQPNDRVNITPSKVEGA